MGRADTQKYPFTLEDLIPWAYTSHPAKRHLDPFICSCRAHERVQQTDRQTHRLTDRPRYSVCINRPHLAIAVAEMQPNISSISNVHFLQC